MRKKIAIVLKGYPRLSETFIAAEIHSIEQAGISAVIFSLRRPRDAKIHPVHRAIRAKVNYLPEYLWREPLRVLRAWLQMRRRPQYRTARELWLRDLKRDWKLNRAINRMRRFGQALVMANELPADTQLLYAHFLHTPASVARYAARLLTLDWACSAHAKDIWTTPRREIIDKINDCRWLTTCTRANFNYLRAAANSPRKVHLNYHGIELAKMQNDAGQHCMRDGSRAGQPARILSVGRAVAKKGYAELLIALAQLPKNLHWQLTHIGGGPLLTECRRQSRALGIADNIKWRGAQSREVVVENYRAADFFVLNCCIAKDGDRDGLPNVLLEAQSYGLAVVATVLSGIPELIIDRVNGLLVQPGDTAALTAALQSLIIDTKTRRRLGLAGRKLVAAKFDRVHNFKPLYKLIAGDETNSDVV